jgi:hypothetical protein
MPSEWLEPWPQVATLDVHVTRTRLCVWHPGGFTLCDVPRDSAQRPLAQARAIRAHRAPLRRVYTAPAQTRTRSPTDRWLRWLLSYLQARLAVTLGLDDAADVPTIVCRHAADIAVTPTAVHVHFSLTELPLSIRIAGLDRDAGWIPAAGRSLTFHFR